MKKSYLNSVSTTIIASKLPTAIRLLLMILFVSITSLVSFGQSPATYSASGIFTVPAGVTTVNAQVWGAGGAGGGSTSTGAGGAGGGAGGYTTHPTFAVSPGTNITCTVGTGGIGSTGANGLTGGQSSFSTLIANGGAGGNANNGSVGLGGTASGGTTNTTGGNGLISGGNTGGNGGNAPASGGTGGAGQSNADGSVGNSPGGGGGGGEAFLTFPSAGGNGGTGRVIITWTCPTYSLTGANSATATCTSAGTSTVTLVSSAAGLPVGTYTVTYNTSAPVQTGLTATMTVSTAGTGTFTATGLTSAGSRTITVTNLSSGTAPSICSNAISTNNTATVIVTANVVPSITIAITTGSNPVCNGSSVTFTATPTNGGTPTYQWTKNGTNIGGATSATYTSVAGTNFVSTDVIRCVLTPTAICVTPSTATSTGITMTVNALPTGATAGADQSVCGAGTNGITLAANAVGPGETGVWTFTGSPAIASTSNPATTVTLAPGTSSTFTWTITNSSCSSSDSVLITNNALPTVTSTTGNTKTYTGTANATTVSAAVSSGATIDWYDAPSAGNLLASGSLTYAPTGINVGTYTVYAQARNTTTGCFSTSRTAATLTINTATLTVTANTATHVYGATLTPGAGAAPLSVTGMQNSETLAGTVTLAYTAGNTAASAVGTYSGAVSPSAFVKTSGSAVLSNYSITYVTNNLSVTAATLTVTANTATHVYGATLTPGAGATPLSVTGMQNSETLAGTVTLAYTAGNTAVSAVGTYNGAVSPSAFVKTSGTAVLSNYSITYVTNNLSVTAATLTITATNRSKCFGTALTLGTTAFTTSSLQNGETITSVTLTSTGGYAASLTQPASLYTGNIIPSNPTGVGFSASNYVITMVNGDLTINPLPTLTVVNPSAVCFPSTVDLTSATVQTTNTGTTTKYYTTLALANAGGASNVATPSAISAGGTYYIRSESATGCFIVKPVTVIINTTPVITPNKVDETCPASNNGTITPVLSGGLSNIRYIRLTQKHADWQQVPEIEAYEIFTGTNVALASNGATATATSVYGGSSTYAAQKAIDGLLTTFWHSNSTNINEYVQIDLQSTKNIDYLKFYNRIDCCQSRGQNMLLELFDASNILVYSKTVDVYQSGANLPVTVNLLDVSWTDGTTTLNRTGLDSGTYTLNYADAVGCSVSAPITISAANPASIPILGTITHVTCNATGSIVLSGLPVSGTVNQTGSVVASYPITGTTMTISGLAAGTYNFTASNGICSSSATANVVINPIVTNTWTTSWSHGTPTNNQLLVFSGNYPPAIDPDVDIAGCSCTLSSGANVSIKSGRTLTITNGVTVAAGGSLTIENNASLVQLNDAAVNSGNVTIRRNTQPVFRYDYTYWSSPLTNGSGFKLGNNPISLSPGTLSDKFYKWAHAATTPAWQVIYNGDEVMSPGTGYIVRAPQTFAIEGQSGAVPAVYAANFIGIPNNGNVGITVTGSNAVNKWNLIGNPYPSAINIETFLQNNNTLLDGTIYLWTHNTQVQASGTGTYIYNPSDYASYNLSGPVGTAATNVGNPSGDNNNNTIPTRFLSSGQAFFVKGIASGTAQFTNLMRVAGSNNQFFKPGPSQPVNNWGLTGKHRVWLNLTGQDAFNQILVGYIENATNGLDWGYDGSSFGGNQVTFYSLLENKNLVIQGRALPFNNQDEVPLGYTTTLTGSLTISIDHFDGLFEGQDIYLEDQLLNIVHDLKESDYSFTSVAGTFNDRFVLRYLPSAELSNPDPETIANGLIVYKNDNEIKIKSQLEALEQVTVYDLLGRIVFDKSDIGLNELGIQNVVINEHPLIVKVKLANGQVVNKKMVY